MILMTMMWTKLNKDSDESVSMPKISARETETTSRPIDNRTIRLSPVLLRSMPALSRASDGHELSDRSAAAVASAVLEDFGQVPDPRKMRSERKKTESEIFVREQSDFVRFLAFVGRRP